MDNTGIEPTEILADYACAVRSRRVSLLGRSEVVSGRAKFGIFGDGKEIAQVALARSVLAGDWHAGYYRDQTLLMATGQTRPREVFAQLYGDTDIGREPASGGRQMVNHFASRLLSASGTWLDQTTGVNSAAGFGAVAVQMASALGLAYASRLYRADDGMKQAGEGFSRNGNEVVFAAIGNASAAEGIFFETVNAAAVLQVPLIISVWDDGYGISVPNELQLAFGSVSKALSGFGGDGQTGIDIHVVSGSDYPSLRRTYASATGIARHHHRPSLVHVTGLTQPLGHSTSGSHEKYKDPLRLKWEAEHDCIDRMRAWIVQCGIATDYELGEIESRESEAVVAARDQASDAYRSNLEQEAAVAQGLIESALPGASQVGDGGDAIGRRLVQDKLEAAAIEVRGRLDPPALELIRRTAGLREAGERQYRSQLYSESAESPLRVLPELPRYRNQPEILDGRSILVRFFDAALASDPRLFVLGEDVGRLGDVNLVYDGLRDKYGDTRITDTGIREATILGQGIGCALRGLRPIVDIQYLDYFLFALEVASDDLATLHYRTAGGQKAPVVIRTKGHRLVGMTHSGSPMAVLIHACRGIYLCVPRDMTRAAGMYGTLLRGDNPGIVIEVLNGYWRKEPVPDNLTDLALPLGVPEVIRQGGDVTVVTYGAMCQLALEAAATLEALGIDTEVIDAQTLLPFDVAHRIVESVRRTGAVIFADEDVPGGATAYMLREVLEVQGAFHFLDSPPRTVTASDTRPAYGGDGDYFTKPSCGDLVRAVYDLMSERSPRAFPPLAPRSSY